MAKDFAQISIKEDLRRKANETANLRGMKFSRYVTRLIEKDIEFYNNFPYIVLRGSSTVYLESDYTARVFLKKKLRLLRDMSCYLYNFDLDPEKVNLWIKKGLTSETDVWNYFSMKATSFDSGVETKDEDVDLRMTGVATRLQFPEKPRGLELDVDVEFSINNYVLTRSDINRLDQRDSFVYQMEVPCQQLTLDLYIAKDLYRREFAMDVGGMGYKFIFDSTRHYFIGGTTPYVSLITSSDEKSYGISIRKEEKDQYFRYTMEMEHPIFGVNFRTSWIRPFVP